MTGVTVVVVLTEEVELIAVVAAESQGAEAEAVIKAESGQAGWKGA